jgi:colanic acid biosynthesis glycosyl transferase WcaI
VFIGDGPLKSQLIQQASQSNLNNVYFLESLPHIEMPAVLASADFCIVPLGMEMPGAVPSKLYEAMSTGCPVLLMAHGEAAEIVRAHDCGLVVAPGDINALTNGLRTLACNSTLRTRLGTNGRRAAQEHYDRTTIVERFAKFLDGEKQ